ncbi:cobyric acid synthase [Silvibacterium dinghuense]|uniref:Cobyric acid synthase n=1 Tax=Silvibacterium dinghuense TaxID=1560006 RepID=A0A4Q1SJ62_9BACT|nr:cobyric acid synthase [Silvibacterium dinghuense]RXS97674.1 cobyric acid synthase [Silvibacterium dinghuense]GGH01022.1 cobyric acid synthase [Silvibacterium dinghuense]
MTARAMMVLGTSSHVGKSLLAAALCRIFAQQGYSVAPFKSQNMSLNSAATPEGLEIGRAQALQAEAAGIAPSVHMNPILLKPAGNMSSQVIVHGRIWGRLSAAEYHLRRVDELLPRVRESYETLAAEHDVLVLEGAGSPAEINLKQHDIVNMRMAEMADAACLLVGDIDRGGVFASLLGTVELLEPHERERIRGFVINKFRGDVSLLMPGIRMIEERLGKPCLGVVPYLDALALEEEDSLGLPAVNAEQHARWAISGAQRPLRMAVVGFPSLSNFTDFDALLAEPSVAVRFCRKPEDLRGADVVILPGSKQTADDLLWMRDTGLEQAVLVHAAHGLVLGICGGMQMLGEAICDPEGVESHGELRGLCLLPIRTTMRSAKITRNATGKLASGSLFGQPVQDVPLRGYEIHVGETMYIGSGEPFAQLIRHAHGSQEAIFDGCVNADRRIVGTYLHGLFDEDGFRHAFLAAARAYFQLEPAGELHAWGLKRQESFDRLAEVVQKSLDMASIFAWAGLPYAPVRAEQHREIAL